MEVSGRHARAFAVIRDTISPGNRNLLSANNASPDVARVVSDVSVLCPAVVDPLDNTTLDLTRRSDPTSPPE
jgi:hypothetical protein